MNLIVIWNEWGQPTCSHPQLHLSRHHCHLQLQSKSAKNWLWGSHDLCDVAYFALRLFNTQFPYNFWQPSDMLASYKVTPSLHPLFPASSSLSHLLIVLKGEFTWICFDWPQEKEKMETNLILLRMESSAFSWRPQEMPWTVRCKAKLHQQICHHLSKSKLVFALTKMSRCHSLPCHLLNYLWSCLRQPKVKETIAWVVFVFPMCHQEYWKLKSFTIFEQHQYGVSNKADCCCYNFLESMSPVMD